MYFSYCVCPCTWCVYVCACVKMGALCEQFQEARRVPPHVQLLSPLPVCEVCVPTPDGPRHTYAQVSLYFVCPCRPLWPRPGVLWVCVLALWILVCLHPLYI